MPQASPDRPAVVRFGPFTLDLHSGELSRDGARTRLQDQPFALLRCLLEHPGRLVTRDELRRRLWPNGTMVDFGLAKLAGHGERPAISFDSAAETRRATLTGQGTVLGTLPYMAPEQVEGK